MARHRKLTQKFAGFPIFKVGTSGDTFPVTSPFTTGFTGYGDGLSLDLQFATDKTLTARKGPTPVFTRGSTGTFVGSDGLLQSAAVNAARFDHDPLTLACKGLLIEESRTNSWSASEVIGSSPWTTTSTTTVNPDNTASPNGLTTADRLTVGSTTQEYGFQRNTFSFVGGTAYSISFFFKANQITRINIVVNNSATIPINAIFDLTGSGSIVGIPTGTASIQQFSNGWYRCSVSATALASAITSVRVAAVSGTSISYPGNSVDSFWAWGAQLEAGSFATSYIPTVASTVVRSADLCSISGSNFTGFWNQSAGTLLEVFEASPNTNTTYVSASNGNITQNSVHIDNDTGNMRAVYYSGSSLVATLSLDAVGTVGAVNKISTAYSLNDFSASRNGAAVVTDSSGTVPASLSQINIGADERSQTPTSFYSNKCITSLRYYKKRLPDAKLQSLTDSYDYTTSGGDFYVKSAQGRYSYR
jgi:hypothetical protein